MYKYLFLVLSFVFSQAASAAVGLDKLDRFHKTVKSFNAEFNQTLTDAQANKVQESSGRVWIQRPGKFRWEYNQPFPQIIVADGKHIWIYDPELEQVTVKKSEQALGSAPAMVLSGAHPLERDFHMAEIDRSDGLNWVLLTPKQEDTDFRQIAVAFSGDELAVLELTDKLGQRTQIRFKSSTINKQLDNSRFSFKVPEGTDVIGGDQL